MHIRIAIVIIFTLPTILSAQWPGRASFEEAYRTEEKEPEEAIRLYRRALSLGLEPAIAQAAKWKLYYLYRKTKDLPHAVSLLSELGQGRQIDVVYDELRRNLKSELRIQDEAVTAFIQGVRALHAKNDKDAQKFFRAAVKASPRSMDLRGQIARILSDAGHADDAVEFLDEAESSAEILTLRADVFLATGRTREAEAILRDLAESPNLDDEIKARVLYLLGRVARSRDELEKSARYFRLAGNYANTTEWGRQMALSAYSLYRMGLPLPAKRLLDSTPPGDDENIEILSLILRVEVDGDAKAKTELRRVYPKMKEGYLARRARELLDRK